MLSSSPVEGTPLALDFVAEFPRVADRFATDVARSDMHVRVPACPRWTTYDLAVHLGNVHGWAATVVETGRAAVEHNDTPRSRRPRAVAEWYVGKAEDLRQVLRATPQGRPCWNFVFGEGVAAFWTRRQVHETLVHLVDLHQSSGRTTDLPTSLAADGVDEVLTVFLHRMHYRGYPAVLTAPLSLVATDADRAWTLTPRPAPRSSAVPAQGSPAHQGPPLVIPRRHPQADRIEAPSAVLLTLLWRRSAIDQPSVTLSGNVARVEAFLASRLTP